MGMAWSLGHVLDQQLPEGKELDAPCPGFVDAELDAACATDYSAESLNLTVQEAIRISGLAGRRVHVSIIAIEAPTE